MTVEPFPSQFLDGRCGFPPALFLQWVTARLNLLQKAPRLDARLLQPQRGLVTDCLEPLPAVYGVSDDEDLSACRRDPQPKATRRVTVIVKHQPLAIGGPLSLGDSPCPSVTQRGHDFPLSLGLSLFVNVSTGSHCH